MPLILILIIVVSSVVFTRKIRTLQGEVEAAKLEQLRLKERFGQYEQLVSQEDYERELAQNIQTKQQELEDLAGDRKRFDTQIRAMQAQLRELEEEDFVQSFGFYQSKYDFEDAQGYKNRLDEIRNRQKFLVKDKMAAMCRSEWVVEGSKKKGQKMTNDFLKLVLRAFNGECDAAVLKVKYNNITSLERRINKAFDTLNKLSESTHCEITRDYLDLKLEELYLTHEYQVKKQEEREEQRQIREQMREEERARKEVDKAKEAAEREEKQYEKALEKARQEVERSTGEARDELERQIEQLAQQLEEAHTNKERAVSRAQLTKSGHVYVISNLGSFGENVYKIGLTRRLEPLDRVKELGDASVPFPFDVHAMIFSQDAPELEKRLHQHFQEKQLNKVNPRKEFFRVSLDEIASAVAQISDRVEGIEPDIHFTKVAEAAEYRQTLALERNTPS